MLSRLPSPLINSDEESQLPLFGHDDTSGSTSILNAFGVLAGRERLYSRERAGRVTAERCGRDRIEG